MQSQSLAPFLSIWVKPSETIRKIVKTDPTKYVILLATLRGVVQALGFASLQHAGDSLPLVAILAICIILGPIVGIISLYIAGVLFRWTGRWLGGRASSEKVRAAIAWSSAPTIVTMPFWIPELLIFGEELFTSSKPRLDSHPFLAIISLGFAAIGLVIGIWGFVIFLKCLGEVHQFSAWKALAATIMGAFVGILVILAVIFCAGTLFFGVTGLWRGA